MSRATKGVWFALALVSISPALHARPLLTEEVEPAGRYNFEATISVSQREDEFNTPRTNYKTVAFPMRARLGLTRRFDIGFGLTYLSQRLETPTAHYSGSQNGRFSPYFKYSPSDWFGFEFIWHTKKGEQGDQELPVQSSYDYETLALFKIPTNWPIRFNVGYLWRGGYHSKLGVSNDTIYKVEPGNIFESKGSLEIPIVWHIGLLGEVAYYRSENTKINQSVLADSGGEAMDALGGLTWSYAGWNIGAGVAFGLLDEQHSSFNLERGAGDVLYKGTVSYKLAPRKPGS